MNDVSFDGNGHISRNSFMSCTNDNILIIRRNREANEQQRINAEEAARRLMQRLRRIEENAQNVNGLRRDARMQDVNVDNNEIRTNNASRGTFASSNPSHERAIQFNYYDVARPIDNETFKQMIERAVHAQISNTKVCHFTRVSNGGELLNRRWPWQYGSGWIKNVNAIYTKYVHQQATQDQVMTTLEKVPDGCCLCGC